MGTVEFGKKVVSLARGLNVRDQDVIISPNIEIETSNIASDVDSTQLLFIAYDPINKENPRVGMACSTEKFYFCNRKGKPQDFYFRDVATVEFQGKNRLGSYSVGDKVIVTLDNGEQRILGECMFGCSVPDVAELLVEATENAPKTIRPEETYCLSLCDLPQRLQVNYMEILYNYAQITEGEIKSSEYAALQSIGVRIGLEANVRNELRDYMFLMQEGLRTKSGDLIKRSRDAMSYGSYEIFRYSLMQDALYLKMAGGDAGPWYQDRFLNSLQKILEISDEQIEVMLVAIRLYQGIQQRDADLQSLNREMDTVHIRCKSLRIPLEAIFCSGSVYSIDTYRTFRRARQKKSIARQRELMLQEVIRNTQLSMNHLVEDLNHTTLKLLEEVRKGNVRDRQIQELSSFIQLRQFQKQVDTMMQKNDEITITRLYNRLPRRLEAERVAALLPQQRELVEASYVELPEGSYQIRDDLSHAELSRLTRIEEIMDYER